MQVSVVEAGGRLVELVERARGGDEVVLTVDGQPAIRLAPMHPAPDFARRREVLSRILNSPLPAGVDPKPTAARSQDFLYDEDGLPT